LLGIVVAGSMMAPTELAPPWATAIARTATAQNAVPQLAPDPAFQPAVQPAGECRHYRLVQKTVYDDRPVTVYRLKTRPRSSNEPSPSTSRFGKRSCANAVTRSLGP